MRVAFVYANPRSDVARDVSVGLRPDTSLFGSNHLAAHGIEADVVESVLRRRTRQGGLAHRVTWHAREWTLPFELRGYDAVCTPLSDALPFASRITRGPTIVLLSYHLNALLDRRRGLARRLLTASIRSAAAVVCTSTAGRSALLKRIDLPADAVTVGLLGVDEQYWQPLPDADDGYVLAVGRDLARDYGTLAAAADGLDGRVVIAAKRENVEGLRIPSNVEIRIDVPIEEMRSLYRDAACVCIPVRPEGNRIGTESSGTIALLEAMSCGRATVVTDRPELTEYHRPGVTSVAVPPADPAALRSALTTVLRDGALRRGYGGAGRELVEQGLTTRHAATRLAEVLHATVGRREIV